MGRIAASASSLPRPVVKWAGGKAKLADHLEKRMPAKIGTYVEPFCGGAALFFHLANPRTRRRFDSAILTDKNEHLIACYRAIQRDVGKLITLLGKYAAKYENLDADQRREFFYWMRDENKARTDVERAARLLFLNKTCFNGLWRENAAGHNNVPFGRYERPKILDQAALEAASGALKDVKLHVWNYERALARLRPGDFVYFDPPYVPVSKTANFTSYAKDGFSWKDQERLRAVLDELRARDVKAMLSNARTGTTDRLYEGLWAEVVPMARSINSDAKKRGDVEELVVCNYQPPMMSKAAS